MEQPPPEQPPAPAKPPPRVRTLAEKDAALGEIDRINPVLAAHAVPIDTLRLDPGNARLHDARSIDAIAASLGRFGQQKPIVVDSSGVVRAGNGTLAAAKRLGWTKIAAITSDLPVRELRAFAVADNRVAEHSEWDQDVLAGLLADPDVGDVGFSAAEVEDILAAASADGSAAGTVLEELDVRPPPSMTWVLIGVPTVRYGEVAEAVEHIAAVEGVTCEMTSNGKTGGPGRRRG